MKHPELLEGLNPRQREAVETTEGTVQINAVAGSGKTRVITRRIAHMIKNKGIKAGTILCTTFTKKATEEMISRLNELLPKMTMAQLTIGTSHSIGYRILAKEYANMRHHLAPAFKKKLLINGTLKVFADNVRKDVMMDRTVDFQIKEELRDMPTGTLLKVVGTAKNGNMDPYQFEEHHAMNAGPATLAYIEFYKAYEKKKWNERLVDADDLLFLLVRLFREFPDILAKYQKLYKYVMVDEAQDNNSMQWELMSMIAYPENNLFVVGDDDQSMYGFRGARPDQFIYFKDNFRNVQQIPLEDNYRSNPGILAAANRLISHNSERIIKELKAHRDGDMDTVMHSTYTDENEEAEGVVEEIKQMVEVDNIRPKSISILYRTNAQSRALEEHLILSGLPYVIHGSISFYERKEVKDLVSYLRLAVNEHDDEAFKRVINVPSRYLGKVFLEKIKSCKASHYEALDLIELKGYEKDGIRKFKDAVTSLQEMLSQGTSPADMVDYILSDDGVGYRKHILDNGEDEDEGNSRLENIDTLMFALGKYESLADFLEYIDIMTSERKESMDGVQLMTFHKAKGLEFPVVFVVGASEGLLPHFRSIEDEARGKKPLAIEEERRLGYVGVTRAEHLCYTSSILSFNGKPSKVSRFIHELGIFETGTQEEAVGL